jgi:hypothetical protein
MIALDLQTFQQSRESGNVTGVIYVELQSGAFPVTGWSDFPVIILSSWAEALVELETPMRREVQWRFMDGPHSLTLTIVSGDVPNNAVPFAQVRDSLLEAAERVVSYCKEHRMLSKDLETLNVGRLEANQTVQRTGASRSVHIEIRPSVAAGSRR